MDEIKLFDDEKKAPREEFDDDVFDDDDELFDDEEEVEEAPPRREREPRPAKKKKKKKKKNALVPIIVIVAVLLALGAAYYFFLGDFIQQFFLNRQIEALADVPSFADVTSYSEAVTTARLKYDSLDADVQAKVNEPLLAAAETASDSMRAARDSLAALPAADITVAEYPNALAMTTASRAAFDQLTDAQKMLVGEASLTAAEGFVSNCRAANEAVIVLNEDITAFTVSQEMVRQTLDTEASACAALINRSVTMDQTLVDTATLEQKKALVDTKLNQFSDLVLSETSELSGYNYTISGLVKTITDAVAATEKNKYPIDEITASTEQVSATIVSIQNVLSTSTGIASLEHDYSVDMSMQLAQLQGYLADALNGMNAKDLNDESAKAITGCCDNATTALNAFITASQSFFSEITAVSQSYTTFTSTSIHEASAFTPAVGAAATTPAGDTAGDTTGDGTETTPAETPAAEEGEAGYVNAADVNFRDAPSTDGNSLGKQALNTTLTILGEQDGWYKVKIGDKTGYIRSDFVSKGTPN